MPNSTRMKNGLSSKSSSRFVPTTSTLGEYFRPVPLLPSLLPDNSFLSCVYVHATDQFSETQLRSRLKKWRVTKPSRQTRKKSQETSTGDDSDADDFSKSHQMPTHRPSQPAAKGTMTTTMNPEVEWHHHPVSLDEQDLSGAWIAGHHPHQHPRDLSHSPSIMHQFPPTIVPSSSSYDASQPPTPVDGVLLNPSSTMAPFSSPSYTVAPEVCLPSSTASAPTSAVTSVPWSVPPPWYPVSLDGGVPSQSFYTTSPVASSPDHSIPQRIYSPQSMPYQGVLPQGAVPDLMNDSKPWRRAMSLQTENGNESRKYLERKTSMPAKSPPGNTNAFEMVNPSQFFPGGQPPMMCSPIYPYHPDQESFMHKAPASIGF